MNAIFLVLFSSPLMVVELELAYESYVVCWSFGFMVNHAGSWWSCALPMSSLKMLTPIWYSPRSGASTTCASVGENALV